jgi:hypothetical protein
MYEGLLDRELARAPSNDALFVLRSSSADTGAVIRRSKLKQLEGEALIAELTKLTGRTEASIRQDLEREIDERRLPNLGTSDPDLAVAAAPIHRFLAERGVVRPGGLYVTGSDARRMQGAHYTTTTLTEPIVRHTLEPLVYRCEEGAPGVYLEPRQVRAPEAILELKVCDPAMGSGAFLVQVVRYLGDRLVEAWEARMAEAPEAVLTLPFALPSRGDPLEEILPDTTEERKTAAYRHVAERCVYGLDRNRLAAEMAKLSLWLVTLSVGRPFTFLDHALKVGDALVCASLRQIRSWNLEGGGEELPLIDRIISDSIDAALLARRDLVRLSGSDDDKVKLMILARADRASQDLRLLGDLLVGSYFGGKDRREREELRERGRLLAAGLSNEKTRASAVREVAQSLGTQPTFHWEIEFPEVFANSGFDAFVGNPPFLGGRRMRRVFGDRFVEWLTLAFPGCSLNADLCAFFYRRLFGLIRPGGYLGLLATNTIAEGDTRETGLAVILSEGGQIIRAIRRMPWPGTATVNVSVIHLVKGAWCGEVRLDGRPATWISSSLQDEAEVGSPARLYSNLNLSFQGSVLAARGFIISDEEREQLLTGDSKNAEVIQPFLSGQDINGRPDLSPSRWVINFRDWPLKRAEEFVGPMRIVRQRVYPVRCQVRREAHRRYWWHYGDKRPALYKSISGSKRVIGCSRHSSHWAPAFLPIGIVYSDATVIFSVSSYTFFAILQSTLHETWKDRFQSSLRTDPRYTPSHCFDTFPFPTADPRDVNASLEDIGKRYHQHRQKILTAREMGLTRVYNLFHDPRCEDSNIIELRALHQELDERVAEAYGWSGLELGHGWDDSQGDPRWGISSKARAEIFRRLYALNQERHAAEKKNAAD